MSRTAAVLASAALAAALACSRPEPSPDYAAARERHAAILAAHPLDAATRPELEEVLALLRRVPADSADAEAARELEARLVKERDAAREEAEAAQVAVEKAAQPSTWPSGSSIGVPPPPPPAVRAGMPRAELEAAYGPCLQSRGAVQIETPGQPARAGEAWALRDDAECRERHDALVGKVIAVAGDAVVGVQPAGAQPPPRQQELPARTEQRVELVKQPDGTWGMKDAAGKVVPLPAGAEVRVEGEAKPQAGVAR